MNRERPIRVLIAKPGLDGHDRGAKVVVKALRDAGMEVIYTGRHQTVAAIVEAAIQEDVEVLGLSILSGAHMDYCTRVVERLAERGATDLVLLVGGTISASSIPRLRELGYDVFPTGSRLTDIVAHVRARVAERRASRAAG
jgi:methylmalonyl-CoA mutase C-terminal domain/subunit